MLCLKSLNRTARSADKRKELCMTFFARCGLAADNRLSTGLLVSMWISSFAVEAPFYYFYYFVVVKRAINLVVTVVFLSNLHVKL